MFALHTLQYYALLQFALEQNKCLIYFFFFVKVKLQHRVSKNLLEFPFCRNFADDEGERVAELPVLTVNSPFPPGLLQFRNTGKDIASYGG